MGARRELLVPVLVPVRCRQVLAAGVRRGAADEGEGEEAGGDGQGASTKQTHGRTPEKEVRAVPARYLRTGAGGKSGDDGHNGAVTCIVVRTPGARYRDLVR